MHRWPSEYRDPDGRVLDAPRDLGGHLEPGGSSHLVRVAVDRGGYAAGIATVGHVTRLSQRLGARIAPPCLRSGSTRTASARTLDHAPGRGCGREGPIRRYSHQTLRLIGWPLYRVASVVQWCGHRQEFIPVRMRGSGCDSCPWSARQVGLRRARTSILESDPLTL